MTNLSPAAQAVRRDLAQIMHELHQRCRVSVSATDTLPITLETNDASLQAVINSLCAAALRAAVDQVVPDEPRAPRRGMRPGGTGALSPDEDKEDQRAATRRKLLAIATELEETQ